jgi:hypothetical protein
MKSKLINFLFVITLYELALMGSGQMLKIGPLTLRMFLFLITLVISLSSIIITKRIEKYVAVIATLFTATLLLPLLVAILNNNPVSFILDDLKPLVFFYTLFFFSLSIKNITQIKLTNQIIKTSAIILATVYLLIIVGIYTGLLDFNRTYLLLDSTSEVFFRGTSGFFYKGFLYLCIGVFFCTNDFSIKNILIIILIITAIILTFTRGLLFTLALVLIIYLLLFYKNKVVSLLILLVGSVFAYIFFGIYLDALGDKSESDHARYIQISEVKNEIDPFSFFIGHGFGKGTYSREGHIEISYFEIFHKQGLFGLSFYLGLLLYIFFLYYKAEQNGNKQLALPYLLASIFIYLQSFTNPFINNPIGMSVILISIVILKRLEILSPNSQI